MEFASSASFARTLFRDTGLLRDHQLTLAQPAAARASSNGRSLPVLSMPFPARYVPTGTRASSAATKSPTFIAST